MVVAAVAGVLVVAAVAVAAAAATLHLYQQHRPRQQRLQHRLFFDAHERIASRV
jgi:hypothetical protein